MENSELERRKVELSAQKTFTKESTSPSKLSLSLDNASNSCVHWASPRSDTYLLGSVCCAVMRNVCADAMLPSLLSDFW